MIFVFLLIVFKCVKIFILSWVFRFLIVFLRCFLHCIIFVVFTESFLWYLLYCRKVREMAPKALNGKLGRVGCQGDTTTGGHRGRDAGKGGHLGDATTGGHRGRDAIKGGHLGDATTGGR